MAGEDDESPAELAALDHAQAVLAAECQGKLRFDSHSIDLKYVTDPQTGRLAASIPAAVFLATEHVLFVPEETDDALQLLLSVEECQECAGSDRWQAYHGQPEHVRWGLFWIDSVRHGPWVFDGEAFSVPNPVAGEECGICKMLNTDASKLAALCQRFAGVVVPHPVCVGVDPRGLHVRARFGVVRVPFDQRCDGDKQARETIAAMLSAL